MTIEYLCDNVTVNTRTFDSQDEVDANALGWINQSPRLHAYRIVDVESVIDEAHPAGEDLVHDHTGDEPR